MKRRGWTWLVFGLLAGALALALLQPRLGYAYVVDPLARILWLSLRTAMIVDQEIYWIALIFTGFIVAALLLPPRKEGYRRAPVDDSTLVENRAAYWRGLVQTAAEDPGARQALERNLKDLQASLRPLAKDSRDIPIQLPPSRASALRRRVNRWVQAYLARYLPARRRPPDARLLQSVENVLDELENQLEIDHDRTE